MNSEAKNTVRRYKCMTCGGTDTSDYLQTGKVIRGVCHYCENFQQMGELVTEISPHDLPHESS